MMHELYKYLLELLRNIHFTDAFAKPAAAFTVIVIILIIARLLHFVGKKIILKVVSRMVKRTSTEWDDILLKKKVFNGLAHVIPLIFVYSSCFFAAPALEKPLLEFPDEVLTSLKADYYFQLGPILLKFARIYFIYTIVFVLITFLNASNAIYLTTPYAPHRSIKGYIQLVQILIIFLSVILVISVLVGKDPTVLIAGLGAMAAVLLLVFKDTILGFVASIQLSANHMVKIGDWIELPGRHADGTVVDITLNTVKIQNWDKTITTVPTYTLVSDAFINWTGMEESEGRRIKRSLLIDIFSIGICTPEMLTHLSETGLISNSCLNEKTEPKESGRFGKEGHFHYTEGPVLTNIGLFRKYFESYLRNHRDINQEMDVVVRQLQSGDKGIPVEMIAFSRKKGWAEFENVQAEIFDHVFSVLPEFGLKVFQSPSGIIAERERPFPP